MKIHKRNGVAASVGLAAGATAIALLLGSAPAVAKPSYAVHVPSIKRTVPLHESSIKGTVRSFELPYNLYVHDNRGYLDHVVLHQGTIINPTGLTLQPGMRVTIYGRPEGNVFAAYEINTPYQYVPPIDYYPYGAYAYGPWGPGWGWGWGFGWGDDDDE